MLSIDVARAPSAHPKVVALPVAAAGTLVPTAYPLDPAVSDEIAMFLADSGHSGKAGTVHSLPRPAGGRNDSCWSVPAIDRSRTGGSPAPPWCEPRPTRPGR